MLLTFLFLREFHLICGADTFDMLFPVTLHPKSAVCDIWWPRYKTLMVEERVYFPGHKLSLNNSEFILNSPVLFTVQAINVFITGGLPGADRALGSAALRLPPLSPELLIKLTCMNQSLISAGGERKGAAHHNGKPQMILLSTRLTKAEVCTMSPGACDPIMGDLWSGVRQGEQYEQSCLNSWFNFHIHESSFLYFYLMCVCLVFIH